MQQYIPLVGQYGKGCGQYIPALTSHSVNKSILVQQYFVVVKSQENESMHFCPKRPAISKISQQIKLKWRNSKQEKFSNVLILKESCGSFKSYGCLIISFKFIHCFLPKQSKRSFSFTLNLLFKHNKMEMVIHSQLAKIRPSSVKIWRMQVPWDKSAHFSSSWV